MSQREHLEMAIELIVRLRVALRMGRPLDDAELFAIQMQIHHAQDAVGPNQPAKEGRLP